MNVRRIRRPSAAFIVAMVALFAALSGTAGAVVTAKMVPLAKRALVADNAKKLNGFTATQIGTAAAKAGAAASAQVPGPASTAASLVSTKTATFSLAAGDEQVVSATCDSGSKAVGGGFANPTSALVISAGSFPTADGTGWSEDLINESSSSSAAGLVVATCMK